MKSNYSKLYDITVMTWDAHHYITPLTKIWLPIYKCVFVLTEQKGESGVEHVGAVVALAEHVSWVKHYLVWHKAPFVKYLMSINSVQEVEFHVHFVRKVPWGKEKNK